MSLFPSLDNIDEDEEPKIEGHLTFSTVEYTYETFINKLIDGSISDQLIKYDISTHYSNYCNYDNFQNPNLRESFKKIWTNKRFLENFKSVLLSNKNFKTAIRTYNRFICKITYDYYIEIIAPTKEDDIIYLLFDIVNILNEDKIIPLTTFMHRPHAQFIILVANSSFDYSECVERVNYFITKTLLDIEVIDIIGIYSKVFSGGRFSIIFNATMSQLADSDFTPQEGAVFSKITKAIFVILNSIPSIEISKVISGYKNYLSITNKPQRTDIAKTIEEYPRAKVVFDQMWFD